MATRSFSLSKQLIPAATITQMFLSMYYKSEPRADMQGNWKDLAIYSLIDIVHTYQIFYDYADIKNDIYVYATLTRSAQELIADYMYAVGHKNCEQKVKDLLEVRRFGDHIHYEYFSFVKGEITKKQICNRPEWSSSSQRDRILKWGGYEEAYFYDLLCSYTHRSIPNERLIHHPKEIFLLRSYFLGKLIKYLNILSISLVERGGSGNTKLDLALKLYVNKMQKLIRNWDSFFAELYYFTDHNGLRS